MKKNRTCLCCGTKYSYCPDCGGEDRIKPSWYSQFCNEECKGLWETATKFNMGLMDKKEAKKILSSMELKNKEEYVDFVQKDIANILFEEPVVEEVKPAPVFKKQEFKKHEVVETIE